MTKFELPEKPKKTNTSEDFNNLRKAVDELDKFDYTWKTYANKANRRINAANKYIEDLERENQNLKADYNNQAESILLMLKEISTLKSQHQQQALPVVPEFVAEWYEEHKGYLEHGIFLINVSLNKTAIGELTDVERWFNDASNKPTETIFIMKRLGYTVEKPQLFYLKHIDMSKRNSINDLYLKKYIHADLTETGEHRLAHAMSAKGTYPSKDYCAFTQQEIDSMETGSYEQIQITVED